MRISTAVAVILLAIGFILFIPFLLIWSVNGLFGLMIQYTWANWFYALVIILLMRGKYSAKHKSE